MRSSRNSSRTIEQFIDFKLNNFQQSSMYSRIYLQQKQYQKKLNKMFQILQAKQLDYERHTKNFNKLKQHIWNHLIGFDSQIKNIQQFRYKVIEETRQAIQMRQQVIQARKQEQAFNERRQQQLQQTIQNSTEQAQFYFGNKINSIKQIVKNTEDLKSQISVLQPKIKQYYNLQIEKQTKVTHIDKLRSNNQNLIKELWNDTENLQNLKEKVKVGLKEKEEKERQFYKNRKEELSVFFTKINTFLETIDNPQNWIKSAQQIKNHIAAYNQSKQGITEWLNQSETESQKMKQIKMIFGIGVQTAQQSPSKITKAPLVCIDANIQQKISKEIERTQKQIQTQETKISEMISQEEEQIKIEGELDEQINHLKENIRKIQANLK